MDSTTLGQAPESNMVAGETAAGTVGTVQLCDPGLGVPMCPQASVGWNGELAPVSCHPTAMHGEQASSLVFVHGVGSSAGSIQCQLHTTYGSLPRMPEARM